MATRYHWMADTSEEAFAVLVELERKRSPAEKLEAVFALTKMMLKLSEAGVRQLYPHATEEEILLRSAVRRLGEETVKRVYGWAPDA
ncbi:MAG: hypothetical protein ACRD44_00580 [Bryobacteraceae bacterium]